MSLKNGEALITGAGSGIGRSVSFKLAEKGMCVVVVDLDEKGGEETLCLIKESGGEGIFIQADVSKNSDVEKYVSTVKNLYGRIECFLIMLVFLVNQLY